MEANVTGTVHGNTIVLNTTPTGFEGQPVEVTIRSAPPPRKWGDGIRKSAGSWAGVPEMDTIMEEIHRQRRVERGATSP